MELKRNKHSVDQSAYHLVWRPKYNVAVFRNAWVKQAIEQALRQASPDVLINELSDLVAPAVLEKIGDRCRKVFNSRKSEDDY